MSSVLSIDKNLPLIFGGFEFGTLPRHNRRRGQELAVVGNLPSELLRGNEETEPLPRQFDEPEKLTPQVENEVNILAVADIQRNQLFVRQWRDYYRATIRWNSNIVPVITDLNALRREEASTEEPITDFAFATARAVLRVAYNEIKRPIPAPAIAPDGEGGIRIEWVRPRKNVRVVIPSHSGQRTYIYHRRDGESAIDRLSGIRLAEHLRSVILS